MFIKIIVEDEEKMAAYYGAAYQLLIAHRVAGDSAGTGEAFREVIMSRDGRYAGETFVLFNFVDRPKPRDQQSIVGFITGDIKALSERIVAAGGKLVGPLRDMPEHGVRLQFSEDPEGALAENVQLL